MADDRADATDEAVIAVGGELGLDVLECAEYNIGEGGGKADGVGKRRDRELVLARLDGRGAEVSESSVSVESVKLLLGLDCGESVEDKLLDTVASDFIAWYIVRDVVDQICEEGDLEEFVESDQFKTRHGVCCD